MIREDKNCCLFEFDNEKISTRMPEIKHIKLPKIAVMCFFKEIVKSYSNKENTKLIMESYHDIIPWKFYQIIHNNTEIAFCYAPMGAPLSVNIMEDLFINGVEFIIACGGCGVLEKIPVGKILIPTSALRDEGTSFHYIKPSKEIHLNKNSIKLVEDILNNLNIPFTECKSWTTDASKRETPKKIELRKKQGCNVVEMECSALAACAKFRNKQFIELLYSGDILANTSKYDSRNWQFKINAREKLFNISLEIASIIYNQIYDIK